MNLKNYLKKQLTTACENAQFPVGEITVSKSKDKRHGDYSTSMALSMVKTAKKAPIKIAEEIVRFILVNDKIVSEVFITQPGFINFRIHAAYFQNRLYDVLEQKDSFGKTNKGKNKKANVEFVSANPTGPLTVGHGRQAVLGDTVANILEFHGYDVTREYYFNDAGRQMRMLGESVEARYREITGKNVEFPDGGYEGNYIKEIAERIAKKHGENLEKGNEIFKKSAEDEIFTDIKQTLKQLGIVHDQFSNEKMFYETGAIEKIIKKLKENNLVYKADGATWFKTTCLGFEQDRVLIKSTGEPTYRLPDIAYHINKVERKFDLIIDIFGSDHVDTYPDVLEAVKALGHKTEHFKILIHQFVTLMKSGQKVKMSTRKAAFVTLEELIKEIGVDVVRYFFIMRSMNSHLNFDLDLAADQSDTNPVFYLQYAHARICNIIKRSKSLHVEIRNDFDPALLKHDSEIDLLQFFDHFPEIMDIALETLEPQIIVNYLQELASKFHKFYVDCKVLTDDVDLSSARTGLIKAVKIILTNGLNILRITAPEKM